MKKISEYVETLFENVPKCKKNTEIKEELVADLQEKYSDLINEGKNDKQAYKEVIAGIGNIDEIIDSGDDSPQDKGIYYAELLKRSKAKGLVYSISVFLYILSLIVVAVISELGLPDYIAASSFLTIVGVATCIIIYYNISTPNIDRVGNVIGKNRNEENPCEKNPVRGAISGILWTLITIIYLAISFSFGAWHITWIIFIVGSLIESVISLIFSMRGDNNGK